ncbi:glutathione S-transferase [Fusarium pseudocircinatum]|uniref:Glutathione S-transferase n=1 Tax=Fusarium pseudocircinatum TaxID=56676 RepID=A0A8H5PX97_9HYPO|nr:glutathione S-transferase [Fusarium pseudocircinatum]
MTAVRQSFESVKAARLPDALALFEEAASMEVCYFSTTAWKYCGDIIIKPVLGIPRVDKKTLEDIWNELHGALKVMDGTLSGRSYLSGAEFTLVDIWSMPWVSQLIDLKGADIFFAELPHLRSWWERVSLRPAWKEACRLMDGAMEVMRENATNGWELNDAPDTQRITRGGRRKRNEYALVACMLCKSRKVKCDGQWPCQRCTKRGVECSYPRRGNIPSMSPMPTEISLEIDYSPSTDDGITPRISATSGSTTLNETARQPARTGNNLGASLQSPAATDRSPAARRSSFVDTFSLARSCLEANGIVDEVEKHVQDSTSKPCLTLEQCLASASDDCLDSVLDLGYEKSRLLFITFAETIYPIYPCVDLHSTELVLDAVFGRSASHTSQPTSISLTKIDVLKTLLGLTLLIEEDNTSPLARHLQRYVDWSVEKALMSRGPTIDDVVMATLMMKGAWICKGTSSPFVVVTMEYTRLNSEIIGLLKPLSKSVTEGRQHREYLDYKVQRLREQFRDLTAEGRPPLLTSEPWDPLQNKTLMNDLETFLEIRICHARILLRKPLLHSYKGDREKTAAAAVCIQCAKAAIFLCSGVISKAVPLKCLRSSYEYFTVSSLAIILLVVSQDPETYGPESRDAFQEAIRILQVSKCRNFGSGNMCFSFEQLTRIGDRLHMPKDNIMPLLQDFGDIDMGQLLANPECGESGELQALDDTTSEIIATEVL